MSLLDLLLNRRFTPDLRGTPGINPNAPDPRMLPPQMGGNAHQNAPQATQGTLLSPILSRLGPIGRGADGFLGELSGAARNAALSGGLAALAPQTTQGVLQGDQNRRENSLADLNRQLIESQIGLNRARTQGGGEAPKPLTELAKLQADLQAGRIPQEVYDAKVLQVINSAVQERFANTQSLRGEFTKETQDIAKSLQSLGAANALIQSGENPIAQLAAFISTIKSIDNSTVREGELRAFESVQGFVRELENMVSKAEGKGFGPELRRDIADTIQRLQVPLSDLLNKKREFFSEEAVKFKLDPSSVTGSPFTEFTQQPIDDQQPQKPKTKPSGTSVGSI